MHLTLEAIDRFELSDEHRVPFPPAVFFPFEDAQVMCRARFDVGFVRATLADGLDGQLLAVDADFLDRGALSVGIAFQALAAGRNEDGIACVR